MRIPMRDRRRLRRIGSTLRKGDPRLAAMIDMFSRLAAGDSMPGHERLPGRDNNQSWDALMKPRHVDH